MYGNIHIIYVVMEGHRAAVIQADYHVMTNWDATRNSHKCEYYPFRQTQKQTNKKIISFIEQTNTQNIDVNIIHFCKKQTPKKHKRLQNWKDSGNSRNCEYFTNFDCFVLLG